MISTVYSQRCHTYDNKLLKQKLRQLLKPFESLIGSMMNKVVLLKPNLVGAATPDKALTTHPAVVESLIEILKEKNVGNLYLGDGPGGLEIDYNKVLRKTGMKDILERHSDIKLFKVEPLGYYEIKVDDTTLYFPNKLKDVEIIINLPKMKTHLITLYTGAIKNLYGLLPAHKRKILHFANPHPNKFEEVLIKVAKIIRPSLTIFDGIMGMQGNGPSRGFPAEIGYLLASTDLLAIDIVASKLLGYPKNKIHHIVLAEKERLGNPDFKIVGDEIVRERNFKKASNKLLKFITRVFGKHSLRIFRIYPKFTKNRCQKCHLCIRSCTNRAIRLNENNCPELVKEVCRLCLCCYELCENKAIDLEKTHFAKFMTRNNPNYN